MYLCQRFRLSIYVTLGLACACLGYAELAFLPEISVLAAIVAALLVVAYRLEGRWALTIRAANLLGGVIGVGAMAWVAWQFLRPWGGTLLDQLPWPTSLLPYLGPLLMILIPAKLFRPKHIGDFWGLQGIGLIAVALGCAMAGDMIFGALLVAYLVSLVWSLTLFYLYREQQGAGSSAAKPRLATGPRTLAQSGRWAAAVMGLGLVLFLATPRAGEARWHLTAPGAGRMQTGYSEDRPSIDLNNSGTLSLNREVAFEVRATDSHGRPLLGLDPTTRWRGTTFNYYENGRWESRIQDGMWWGRPTSQATPVLPFGPARLPSLGPKQILLEYTPHSRGGQATFLAEPIWDTFPADRLRRIPAVSVFEGRGLMRRQEAWQLMIDGELRPPPTPPGYQRARYKQVLLPPAEAGISPPIPIDGYFLDQFRFHASVPRLRQWTAALVRQLVDAGRLPAAVLAGDPDAPRVPPEHYERVARALEAHLMNSGEFKYTLSLQRHDARLDPVEDFVLHIRKGHCNRFATALTLMLRSQGIPARIVLGFRGLEEIGEGAYEVRQSHAHSWVEALVRRGTGAEERWHWLTLDPTPGIEDLEAAEFDFREWWQTTQRGLSGLFKNFVVEYDGDQQDKARMTLGTVAGSWVSSAGDRLLRILIGDDLVGAAVLLGVPGLAGALWVRRRHRRERAAPAGPPSIFERLLVLLRRVEGFVVLPGLTPRELAADAAVRLRADPTTRDYADLPGDTAVLFYRVRFGRRPLDDTEGRDLTARLDRFDAALRGRKHNGRVGPPVEPIRSDRYN